jgi:hypothetical protein
MRGLQVNIMNVLIQMFLVPLLLFFWLKTFFSLPTGHVFFRRLYVCSCIKLLMKQVKTVLSELKGTVSPDLKCLDMIYIKSPWLGHVTQDI